MSVGRSQGSVLVCWSSCWFLLIVPFGCGARASLEPVEDELASGSASVAGAGGHGGTSAAGAAARGVGARAGNASSSMAGSGTAGSSAAQPFSFAATVLPPCEPGFQQSDADGRNCKYRFDSLCYEDETSVCACACPRSGNSSCVISGFLGLPDQPLQVTCNRN